MFIFFTGTENTKVEVLCEREVQKENGVLQGLVIGAKILNRDTEEIVIFSKVILRSITFDFCKVY